MRTPTPNDAAKIAACAASDDAALTREAARDAAYLARQGVAIPYAIPGDPEIGPRLEYAARLESRADRDDECAHTLAALASDDAGRRYRAYVRAQVADPAIPARVSDDGAGTLTRGAWRGVPSTPGGKAHTDRAPAHSATGCDRGRVRRDATDTCAANADRRRERIAANAPTCKRASGRRVKGGGFVMK